MINIAHILTISRIVLAPIFFLLALIPEWNADISHRLVFPYMVAIFLYIEGSDLADGFIARRWNLITDFGKLLDPFSDVISRMTYFLVFLVFGIMPPLSFLLIMYREFSAGFLRLGLAKHGIIFAARFSGKLKGLSYSFMSIFALYLLYLQWFGHVSEETLFYGNIYFFVTAVIAWLSLFDYIWNIRKKLKK